MDRILVVGVETVVGANLAATLAEQGEVTGISRDGRVRIPRCRLVECNPGNAESVRKAVEAAAPERIIYCGSAAQSCWEPAALRTDESCVVEADLWARAASEAGCGFCYIGCDAIFTGPWIFHEEDSTSHCGSREATLLRQAEKQVLAAHPQALLIRTNAFGWSPLGDAGWIEQRLNEIRTRRLVDQDCVRHATPILATDLATILLRAFDEGLQGVFHIAGAERVNPLAFVQRLAERFDLPWLSIQRGEALNECVDGFGRGECSLQTKQLRKSLCVAMPMLGEGLERLAEQDRNGYRARLCRTAPQREERAA